MRVMDAEIDFHTANDGEVDTSFAPRWLGLQRDKEVRQYDLFKTSPINTLLHASVHDGRICVGHA